MWKKFQMFLGITKTVKRYRGFPAAIEWEERIPRF